MTTTKQFDLLNRFHFLNSFSVLCGEFRMPTQRRQHHIVWYMRWALRTRGLWMLLLMLS